MKNCLKRKSVSLIIVVLLFAIILIPQGVAMARGYIDTSKKCSLKVNISEEWADLKSIDFSVKLYKVADVNQNCLFTPTKDFEDLRDEIDSIDSDTTAEDWLKLAELSTNIITEKEISEYNIIEIKKGETIYIGIEQLPENYNVINNSNTLMLGPVVNLDHTDLTTHLYYYLFNSNLKKAHFLPIQIDVDIYFELKIVK